MAINILMFEIKDAEKEYFAENKIEGCNITFYEECLDMNSCEYGFVPFTYVSAFLGIFAFLILSVHFQTRFMEFLGRHSLIYYVIHVAIIHGINFTIFSLLNIPTLVDVVGNANYNLADYPLMIGLMIIYLVLIVFITWLIILLFSKTPLKRYF